MSKRDRHLALVAFPSLLNHLSRATHWWGLIEWACLLPITPLLLFAAPSRAPLLLVIPTLWVLRRLVLGRFVPHTPVDIPVLVLIVMGGVGFCVSPNPGWSQMKIDALLLGVGLLYATVDLLEPAERLRWVPAGVICLSLALLGLGLLGTRWASKIPRWTAMMTGLPGEIGWLPEGETFFNPNVIGGALLWGLPLSLCLLFWAMRRGERRWGWAAAEGLLLLSQSRGAWLGFAISLLAMLMVAGGRLGRAGAALLLVALLALTLVDPVSLRQATQVVQVDEDSARILSAISLERRFEIWSRAQYIIADFPFTGPGLDAFQYVMPIMYPLFQARPGVLIPHVHNEFLDVAVDLGLPGLVAWQALYIVTFWMLWRSYRRTQDSLVRVLALGSSGALIAHLVYGMVSCAILVAKPNIVFWVIVGLSIVLHGAAQTEQRERNRTQINTDATGLHG
jgi:putative inorganic carbon (HCO3(-)) transporter